MNPGIQTESDTGAPPPAPGPAPRWARWYAGMFLAAFLVCGVVGIEAWPLTGWRLFADARSARETSFQAATVDHAGRETPIRFQDLPIRDHGNVQVLKGFAALSPAKQAAVCAAWADAVRAQGGDVAALRVYQLDVDLSQREGQRGAPTRRTLRWTCQPPPQGSGSGAGGGSGQGAGQGWRVDAAAG
ncbi:MAG TPA: hypothetical protein VF995_02465 [Actinomycetota bacterium]